MTDYTAITTNMKIHLFYCIATNRHIVLINECLADLYSETKLDDTFPERHLKLMVLAYIDKIIRNEAVVCHVICAKIFLFGDEFRICILQD